MKATRLWFLVPFATLFLSFYLCFKVIPFGDQPFMYWWDIPAATSIVILTMLSIAFSILKGKEGEK